MMKNKIIFYLSFMVLIFSMIVSCTSYRVAKPAGNSGKIPPGQAKKIYGTKSAKPFAPGQRKKYR